VSSFEFQESPEGRCSFDKDFRRAECLSCSNGGGSLDKRVARVVSINKEHDAPSMPNVCAGSKEVGGIRIQYPESWLMAMCSGRLCVNKGPRLRVWCQADDRKGRQQADRYQPDDITCLLLFPFGPPGGCPRQTHRGVKGPLSHRTLSVGCLVELSWSITPPEGLPRNRFRRGDLDSAEFDLRSHLLFLALFSPSLFPIIS
jgi:hypothetical protein